MLSKLSLFFLLLLLLSCSKSDKLQEDEQQFVFLNVSLAKVRANSSDSATLKFRLDSVFKVYKTSESDFKATAKLLSSTPDRSEIIFRAISDSLNRTPKP